MAQQPPVNGAVYEREHRPTPPDKKQKKQQLTDTKTTIETKQQIFRIYIRR